MKAHSYRHGITQFFLYACFLFFVLGVSLVSAQGQAVDAAVTTEAPVDTLNAAPVATDTEPVQAEPVAPVTSSSVEIPYGVSLQELKEAITPAPEATFEIYQMDKAAVATDLQDGYWLIVTAGDQVTKAEYLISFLPNIDTTITSETLTIDLAAGTIKDVAYGTKLEDLATLLVPADQATYTVYQTDGTTAATDIADGYKLKVTAGDQTTTKLYTVSVLPNTDATVTTTMGTVDGEKFNISAIPYGTELAAFKASITPADQATFDIYMADGTTVSSELTKESVLIVTAGDKETKNTYSLAFAPNTEATFEITIENLWKIIKERYNLNQ